MKTLLLHVPKFNNFYRPVGDFMWLNYMPMGLLAIADFLDRHGFEVEVVHLGVEWVENKKEPGPITGSRPANPATGWKPISRSVCPYPQVSRYKGSGSSDDALNFICETP